ncbi:MAG: EamA family transporter [Thermoguttaceae bacterium]|nr:EamA family transporter [Thermoguttaceae bacterium]MDW8039374.1 EamA family transporter [Thermoguttaceae bacterium]
MRASGAGSVRMGRLAIIGAALLWSSSGLFAKSAFFADWPESWRGLQLAAWRALFAGLVLLPWVRRPRWNPLLVPLVAVFALMSGSYLSAVVLTTAANAIWLQATSPWWVLIFTFLLFGTWPDRRQWLPLIFAGLGVGLILSCELGPWTAGSNSLLRPYGRMGVLLGLASGAFFGATAMLMRALRTEDGAWLVAVPHLATAALLAPWALRHGIWPTGWQWLVLAAFGTLQMAIPYRLFTWGLRTVSAQEALLLGLLEPVLMPLWVYLAGQETPAWWTLLGAGFILVGLVWRYVFLENWHKNQLPPAP